MSFSSVKVYGEKASPSKVYYNATVINNVTRTDQETDDPYIVYADTRQTPIVIDVSKYDVSVENFVINGATKNLPVFIHQIAPIIQLAITSFYSDDGLTARYYIDGDLNSLGITEGDYIQSMSGLSDPTFNFSTPHEILIIGSAGAYMEVNFAPGMMTPITISDGTAILTNYRNIDYTIYTITMGIFDGTNYHTSTQPIIWETENITPYTVIPTQVSPQLETDYYYCYTYTHWITLVNKALKYAWYAAGGNSMNIGTKCPFFTFDARSGLFTLCQDANTSMTPYNVIPQPIPPPYNVTSTEAGYTDGEYSFVGMNSNLEGLLSNWSTTFYGANNKLWAEQPGVYLPELVFNFGLIGLGNAALGVCNPIGILQNNTQFLVNPFTNENLATSFICVAQDFVSTGTLWSPVSSIVITTTKIPVRNEFVSLPVSLGSQNIGTQNHASSAFQKVLIETPINAVTSDIWRGFVNYQPLTPTYSSMEDSKVALYELDFYVFWRNRLTGALIPLKLYNSGTFSIRLLFDKQD